MKSFHHFFFFLSEFDSTVSIIQITIKLDDYYQFARVSERNANELMTPIGESHEVLKSLLLT